MKNTLYISRDFLNLLISDTTYKDEWTLQPLSAFRDEMTKKGYEVENLN